MMDRYDEAIAYLNKHPEELEFAGNYPGDSPVAGCLFVNASPTLYLYQKKPNGKWLGDPVSIHGNPGHYTAEDDVVTRMIVTDVRLPNSIKECGLEHLPVLAEYQRKFDKWWNRRFPERSGEVISDAELEDVEVPDRGEQGVPLADEDPTQADHPSEDDRQNQD